MMLVVLIRISGAALNWLVAKLENCNPVLVGSRVMRMPRSKYHIPRWLDYSTDWTQGGPIIERELIALRYDHDIMHWSAEQPLNTLIGRLLPICFQLSTEAFKKILIVWISIQFKSKSRNKKTPKSN